MKKLFMMLFAAAAVSTALATDSYLYWMLSDTPESAQEYSYAVLTGTDGDVEIRVPSAKGEPLLAAFTPDASIKEGGSYYLELFSENDESLWKGYSFSYAELAQMGALSSQGAQGPFTGKAVDMGGVPEPTSGLMLLIGMAMLGLKRKRA